MAQHTLREATARSWGRRPGVAHLKFCSCFCVSCRCDVPAGWLQSIAWQLANTGVDVFAVAWWRAPHRNAGLGVGVTAQGEHCCRTAAHTVMALYTASLRRGWKCSTAACSVVEALYTKLLLRFPHCMHMWICWRRAGCHRPHVADKCAAHLFYCSCLHDAQPARILYRSSARAELSWGTARDGNSLKGGQVVGGPTRTLT